MDHAKDSDRLFSPFSPYRWRDVHNKSDYETVTDLQFEDQLITVTYLKADADHSPHYMESQHWQVPHAPRIEGFTFLRWEVQSGDLADGIFLQAVYEANEPTSAPAVYTSPANPAQKLIRNGAVYILSDDQLYTIDGQTVR